MGPFIGEALARFFGWLILALVRFPLFVFTGWIALILITLGFRPQGMWYDHGEFGKVYWFGFSIIMIFATIIAIRIAWE